MGRDRVVVLSRVVAAVAAAVFASACTVQVSGDPVAGTTLPPVPEELTSEVVFEDLTTVDPCSLIDLSVFDELGSAEFATPESLDYCLLTVKADGDDAFLMVGALDALDEDLAGVRIEEFDGGLWLSQRDDSAEYCSQLLVFPDDVTLEVQGSTTDSGTDICPFVEAAMEYVVGVVLDGDVEHREPKKRSLITVDPCEVLSDADVQGVPGFEAAAKPAQSPAEHGCYWETGSGANRMSVRLTFGVGREPEAFRPGANETLIAGRESATNPYDSVGDGSYCAVETGHILFEEVDGEDIVEVAGVFVRMPAGQVNAGCQAAVAVATIVWPELPKS